MKKVLTKFKVELLAVGFLLLASLLYLSLGADLVSATVDSTLPKADLNFPIDDAQNQSRSIWLQWSPVVDCVGCRYQVYLWPVGTEESVDLALVDATRYGLADCSNLPISTTKCQVDNLVPNQSYLWSVVTVDDTDRQSHEIDLTTGRLFTVQGPDWVDPNWNLPDSNQGEAPTEEVIFDTRLLLNPPPGWVDLLQ